MRDSVTRMLALTIVGSLLTGIFVTAPLGAASRPSGVDARVPEAKPATLPALHALPLSFEANVGQAPVDVRYYARLGQQRLLLTDRGAVLDLRAPNTQAAPAMQSPGRRHPSPTEKNIARLKGAR